MTRKFEGNVDLFVGDLPSAEGPAMDASGQLYVADSVGRTLWRVSPSGAVESFAHPAGPNGSALHWNGDCYVTDPRGHRIARCTPSGQVFTVIDAYEQGPLGNPNDLTFHPSGALYFTVPVGHYADNPIAYGRVYRLGPRGDLQIATEDVPWPNGVNVNADGSVLLVADSHTGQILAHDIDSDGMLKSCTVLADMRKGQENQRWAPDGMCLDTAGNLYVAVYGSYRVRRVTPEGEIDLDIPVGHEKPANCCFGGPDNDELFITCREGAVYRARIGIPGLALFGS
jgi:gluconolactonase